MKKFIAAIMVLLITAVGGAALAENGNNPAPLLSALNIMVGDENGDLQLDRLVSRAEFTKVAVASSNYRNSVATGLKTSSYKDVPATHWAAPYIKVGVDSGFCKGYIDATFKPDNSVKAEEAITMLLRVLGYSDEDFGNSWPYGQVGLAENLGLTEGVEFSIGEQLTRKKVAMLLYNTLDTKMKNSSQKLISIFDVQKIEDAILVSSDNTWKNEVYTSKGTFKADVGIGDNDIGKYGDIYVEDGEKLIAFIPDDDEMSAERHIVYSTLEDNVVTYNNNKMNSFSVPANTTVYENDVKGVYSAIQLKMGDVLYIRRKSNNDIDFIIYEEGNVEGPFTVTAGYSLEKYSGAKVLRNGENSDISEIQKNDIIYYVPELNAVFGYSNKIVGVYEKAEPNKDAPTYITVSGNRYKVESGVAFEKLSSAGSFKYGDTVTLLLGKTNDVCDVMTTAEAEESIFGYMYETGTKEYIKSDLSKITSMYIKVVTPDGRVNEYQTDKNYSNYKNSLRKIVFENGKAKAENVNTSNNISGVFDWGEKRLGDYSLASDVKILDISTTDSNEYGKYVTVFPERLDGVKIPVGKILYYEKDDKNRIESIILDNVTGDLYSYGVVKKAVNVDNDFMTSGSYVYDIGGEEFNLNSSGAAYSVSSGQVAQFDLTPTGTIQHMKPITAINEKITEISKTSLKAGNEIYLISDNVSVYKKDFNNNYTIVTFDEVIGNKDYSLTAYYDKSTASGGRVRVIVARENK